MLDQPLPSTESVGFCVDKSTDETTGKRFYSLFAAFYGRAGTDSRPAQPDGWSSAAGHVRHRAGGGRAVQLHAGGQRPLVLHAEGNRGCRTRRHVSHVGAVGGLRAARGRSCRSGGPRHALRGAWRLPAGRRAHAAGRGRRCLAALRAAEGAAGGRRVVRPRAQAAAAALHPYRWRHQLIEGRGASGRAHHTAPARPTAARHHLPGQRAGAAGTGRAAGRRRGRRGTPGMRRAAAGARRGILRGSGRLQRRGTGPAAGPLHAAGGQRCRP